MQAATTPSHRAGWRWLPLALGALLVGCAPKSVSVVWTTPRPVRGDPVRVTTGDHREVYEFRQLGDDVLVVERGSGADLSIPLASVDELEVVVGHQRRTVLGGVVGLAVGAGFGALMGRRVFPECDPDQSLQIMCLDDAEARTLGAVIAGGIGAGVGALIGSKPTAVWAPVDSTALQIQAHASPGGLGLQLSWRP
jgi:hypothetical protein